MSGAHRHDATTKATDARRATPTGPLRLRGKTRRCRSRAYIVEAEFNIELNELMIAPASAARSTPRSAGGRSSRTSTGYAWSGWAIWSP